METNDLLIGDLTKALEANTKLLEQSKRAIEEMTPKAELFDQAMNCNNLFDLRQSAKLLNYPGIGGTTLKSILRDMKILIKNDTPKDELIDRKLMSVKMVTKPWINKAFPVAFFTPKGLDWIRKKLNDYFAEEGHERQSAGN